MLIDFFDVAIIGGGPAGISGSIYSSGCNMNTGIFCGYSIGGIINTTDEVINYLGYRSISGIELAEKFHESIKDRKNCNIIYEIVVDIVEENHLFKITTNINKTYYAASIIVASGCKYSSLSEEITKKCTNIYYCATCDGLFVENKKVVIVGGGNSAIGAAIYLANLKCDVTIVYRGEKFKRPHEYLLEEMRKFPNVKVIYNSNITNIDKLSSFVNTVEIIDNNGNKSYLENIAGIFIYIGRKPLTSYLSNLNIVVDEEGYIIVDEYYETSKNRIYAAGDIIKSKIARHSQLIQSASEGMCAALNINDKYRGLINELHVKKSK